MARSQETYNKKEVRNKKEKKRKDKEKRRQDRKESGKSSLDDMIAYVDENGVISDTPPDPNKKTKIKAEDIELGVPTKESNYNPIRTGRVSFYNDDKGFGFIVDEETTDKIFVHINNVDGDLREGLKVTFEVEKGDKGPVAVRVSTAK